MSTWRRLTPSFSKPRDSYRRCALAFVPKTASSAFLKPRTRIHSRIRSISMRPRPTPRHPSRIAMPIPPTWRVFAYVPAWQSAEPIASPPASGRPWTSQRELVEHLGPSTLAAREERVHLLLQLGRHLRVDVGEEGLDRRRWASLDLFDRRLEEIFELGPEFLLGVFGPQALQLEVLPHPLDRIALRPRVDFLLRSVACRVVARGIGTHSIRARF